jgi:hypothetical protein
MNENTWLNWSNAFQQRSSDLADPQVIQEKWLKYCRDNKRYYLHGIHGKPSFLRRIFGKLDLLHILDKPDKQRKRLNMIRCESHREALMTILETEIDRR